MARGERGKRKEMDRSEGTTTEQGEKLGGTPRTRSNGSSKSEESEKARSISGEVNTQGGTNRERSNGGEV